jgi:hypothetical protein
MGGASESEKPVERNLKCHTAASAQSETIFEIVALRDCRFLIILWRVPDRTPVPQ